MLFALKENSNRTEKQNPPHLIPGRTTKLYITP